MERILAALDFSPISDKVAAEAAALAGAFVGELTLLHVAAPRPDFVGYEAGPQSVRDGRAEELRGEHRKLQDLAASLRASEIQARGLLLQGPTAQTIVSEAERMGADAIVVGSHGHGALYRGLLGSVSEEVTRIAGCTVVVVPDGRRGAE